MLKANNKILKPVIPDSSYAGLYRQLLLIFVKNMEHLIRQQWEQFQMLALMAQKAEEYGSHDKTFEITSVGTCTSYRCFRHHFICHMMLKLEIFGECAR